jgi:hypothetical protein
VAFTIRSFFIVSRPARRDDPYRVATHREDHREDPALQFADDFPPGSPS